MSHHLKKEIVVSLTTTLSAALLEFVYVCKRSGNVNNYVRNEGGVQTEGSQNITPS